MKNNFALFVLSIVLFLGGAFILSLKVPFWSLFLGIASIQIGIIFIIFTFETHIRSKSKPLTDDYKAVPCLICRQTGLVPKYKNTNICDSCQVKIAQSIRQYMTIFILVFSLGSLLIFGKQNYDFRKNAAGQNFVCTDDVWSIPQCSCSKQANFECGSLEFSKTCSNGQNYCCSKKIINGKINWDCRKAD